MLNLSSDYGALPFFEQKNLRACQYDAEIAFEQSLRQGGKRSLAVLATGAGKTYLACLASYRMLNYTKTDKVLFLVDRNNLARQTKNEYETFTLTEKGVAFSKLYQVSRLSGKKEDLEASVVVSTIQKLFAVLNGSQVSDDEDEEDNDYFEDKTEPPVVLEHSLTLPPDFFQFIVVDECHRSIYGKWKSVLDYFKDACILGLTATPTEEAYAFFNKNIIEKYPYEQAVVDGVNVAARIYDISTETTLHGNTIKEGQPVNELIKSSGKTQEIISDEQHEYTSSQLDREVVDLQQIETVIRAYKDAVYKDLFPTRDKDWAYIPKTLIFAKDENHAATILEIVRKVFGEEFPDHQIPEHFAQKITYKTEGSTDDLIRDFRNDKDFRIAVTVTLVATGTDIKPLEVVLFMNDVKSEVLYTQMKGRGCRTIGDDKLREVTPNADTKSCYYLVDAVGVTRSEKMIHSPSGDFDFGCNHLSLKELLEHLAHGEYSDKNLILLMDYCSAIHARYENNTMFHGHLDQFITVYGFSPRSLANAIYHDKEEGSLPPFFSSSAPNTERHQLVQQLIDNLEAREKLLELNKGYTLINAGSADRVIASGFSKENARSFIQEFEHFLQVHKDRIEALRIIYNSENVTITHTMLENLQDTLRQENKLYTPYCIWTYYKLLDTVGVVEKLDMKTKVNCLTNLMQIVRFSFHKDERLISLYGQYAQRFNLFCGWNQRALSIEQKNVMKQIADYIVEQGAITLEELNKVDTDLWRRAVLAFPKQLVPEFNSLTNYILKVA